MGITKAKGRKNTLDKIYTSDANASSLLKNLDLTPYDLVIEPSAGGGAFNRAIERHHSDVDFLAYDIQPEYPGIIQKDFLTLDLTLFKENKILILGNPPYGQQNKLALEFINYSANFSNVHGIAFILPKSFRKTTIQDRINSKFSLTLDLELDNNEFLLDGKIYKVNTCFQFWERQEKDRVKNVYLKNSKLFTIVNNVKEADLRIQRVGGRAGKAFKDLTKSPSSNYLIKLNGRIPPSDVDIFIEGVNNCIFPTIDYTVGPKSLSRHELFEVLNEYFKEYLD